MASMREALATAWDPAASGVDRAAARQKVAETAARYGLWAEHDALIAAHVAAPGTHGPDGTGHSGHAPDEVAAPDEPVPEPLAPEELAETLDLAEAWLTRFVVPGNDSVMGTLAPWVGHTFVHRQYERSGRPTWRSRPRCGGAPKPRSSRR